MQTEYSLSRFHNPRSIIEEYIYMKLANNEVISHTRNWPQLFVVVYMYGSEYIYQQHVACICTYELRAAGRPSSSSYVHVQSLLRINDPASYDAIRSRMRSLVNSAPAPLVHFFLFWIGGVASTVQIVVRSTMCMAGTYEAIYSSSSLVHFFLFWTARFI